MTFAEQFEALEKAARYLHLYDKHAEGLAVHSASIYQFFAQELLSAAKKAEALPMMLILADTYPCIREIVETVAITQMLEDGRELSCPELNVLLTRLSLRVM